MKRQFFVAALALTMTTPLALAQSANNSMSSGSSSGKMSNSSTMEVTNAVNFVPMAAQSNMTEIQMAKLALKMSDNEQVKQFANTMIEDHTKASKDLKAAVAASGANVKIPMKLDSQHQAMVDKLKNASKDTFDKMYIDANVKAHKKAVALFQGFATDGKAGEVKTFAKKTLPTLKEHLQMAQKLNQAS